MTGAIFEHQVKNSALSDASVIQFDLNELDRGISFSNTLIMGGPSFQISGVRRIYCQKPKYLFAKISRINNPKFREKISIVIIKGKPFWLNKGDVDFSNSKILRPIILVLNQD